MNIANLFISVTLIIDFDVIWHLSRDVNNFFECFSILFLMQILWKFGNKKIKIEYLA